MMNIKLQKLTIGKKIKSMGVDIDLVDIDSHIDRTLTLEENMRSITEDLAFIAPKRSPSRSDFGTGSIKALERLDMAHDIHRLRSPKSRMMDNKRQAREMFDPSELNKKNFRKWKKKPNRYDILGVDTKFF